MKEYSFEINIRWVQAGIEAESKEEARDKLKETFLQEFGFEPEDEEIKVL